jgi:uncharacterized membrane protein
VTPEYGAGAWASLPDGAFELQGISSGRRLFDRAITGTLEGAAAWLARHWLLVLSVALALLMGIAVLVPVLYTLGWQELGRRIFTTYHLICAQIPSHSYFLFGYQVAMCARNLAIYGSLLAGTLAFRSVRGWLPPLDWRLWMATMLPMALDGGTQLFGWRESTWELRTLTGVIFGLGVCWFALPIIEDAVTGRTPLQGRIVLDLRFLRTLFRMQRQGAPA